MTDELKLKRALIIMKTLIVVSILGQRIAFDLGGFYVPLIFLFTYVGIGYLCTLKLVKIDGVKLFLFYLVVTVNTAILLIQPNYELTSYAYLILCYLPFIFIINTNESLNTPLFSFFQNLMSFAAILAIVQFSVQFVGVENKDYLAMVIPENLLISGYNTFYPLSYGSPLDKPNAIFFLEPSFLSQFLAVALIIELLFFRRIHRILLFSCGLLFSFSGTGLLLAGLFAPLLLLRLGLKSFVLITVFVIGILSFFSSDVGESVLHRTGELSSQNSSGFARFIAPFRAINDVIEKDERYFFYGTGAGTVDSVELEYNVNYSAIPKYFIEYGFISTCLFFTFFLVCVLRNTRSRYLSTSLLFMYLFLSGSLLQPQIIFLLFILVSFLPVTEKRRDMFVAPPPRSTKARVAS